MDGDVRVDSQYDGMDYTEWMVSKNRDTKNAHWKRYGFLVKWHGSCFSLVKDNGESMRYCITRRKSTQSLIPPESEAR